MLVKFAVPARRQRFPSRFLFSSNLLVLSFCLSSFDSCKDGGVVPPVDNKPDTTTHNFIWRIDTLGDGNSSVLIDVAIIDDNNIWAVGEIYLKDTSGQFDPQAYNAARWDGAKWNLVRIIVRDYGSIIGYFPLKAVFAFSANDVWFASDADLIQWNGSNFSGKAFFMTSIPFDGQVLRMWGRSSADIICVGRNGSIYRFNGSSWTKLSSGTSLDVQDIWGANALSGLEVLAVASSSTVFSILRIGANTVDTASKAGIKAYSLVGTWFFPGTKYYVVGDGIYRKTLLSDSTWSGAPLEITPYYSGAVRGTATNNVYVVGAFGDFLHYNGSTWRRYPELFIGNGSYYAVSCSGKVVVAVGLVGSRATALIGQRQ